MHHPQPVDQFRRYDGHDGIAVFQTDVELKPFVVRYDLAN